VDKIKREIGAESVSVEWNLKKLRDEGRIRRIGPDKGGHWEVIVEV